MLKKQTLIHATLTLTALLAFALTAWAAEPNSGNPGQAYSDRQAGGPQPGTVLIYNLYTSDAANVNQETEVHITNTNPAAIAALHLFFIDGNSCAIADAFICLTPSQTATFLASDVDPGTTGYLIDVPANYSTGCHIRFNYLIGSELVKLRSGHTARRRSRPRFGR